MIEPALVAGFATVGMDVKLTGPIPKRMMLSGVSIPTLAGPRIPSVPKNFLFFVIINSSKLLVFQYF